MNKTFKIIALFLATLFLLLSFAACSNKNGGDEITTEPSAETTISSETTSNLYLDREKDNLPELNFNNEEVKILNWNAQRLEFSTNEDDDISDRIVSAVDARNEVVQQRLGVKFVWEEQEGDNTKRDAFTKYVDNLYQSGYFYDIIAAYNRTAAMLTIRGFLKNLNAIEDSYLDFNQNWWPKAALETCTIGDALYFISGDISTSTLHCMYGIFYNKDLIKIHNLENPVELVQNKQWTIDKLIEITSDTYQDLDSDTKQSAGDFYGFCTNYYNCDAFYTGSDLKLVERDDVSTLIISPDFSGEKTIDLVSKLGAWLTSDCCFISPSYKDPFTYMKPFINGNAIFCQNQVLMADATDTSGLNDVSWTYGILPTPLYNTDQSDYITVMGNDFTLYSIGNGSTADERNTAVLECWASEGYRRTTPAIFEVNMKMRYSKGVEDADMFDILRDTCRYDLGRIFSDSLSYMSEMPSLAAVNNESWKTQAKSQSTRLKKALASIVTSLNKVAENQ